MTSCILNPSEIIIRLAADTNGSQCVVSLRRPLEKLDFGELHPSLTSLCSHDSIRSSFQRLQIRLYELFRFIAYR